MSEIQQQNNGHWVQVVIDVPLPGPFEYRVSSRCVPGVRVIVPFGKRRLIGVVISVHDEPTLKPEKIREVERVLDDLPPMGEHWFALCQFAAKYYHRPLGEVMLPVLPAYLRQPSAYLSARAGEGPVARFKERQTKAELKAQKQQKKSTKSTPTESVVQSDETNVESATPIELTSDQQQAVTAITQAQGFQTFLLYGVTGAGKTEVYLQAARDVLLKGGVVLFLVPEINLTPQFAAALRARLVDLVKDEDIAMLHSGLSEGQRLAAWVAAVEGRAKVVLGTRLAIFTPLPRIDLIVVDEEHDPSYKQQEGLRYSARDLAVWRAREHEIPIVLGSATPSLESWWHAGRAAYQRLTLASRAITVALPEVRLVDTRRQPLEQGLSVQVRDAMTAALEQKRQVLVYLNRRGYAPVLHCASCGWVSQCDHCSVYTVLHKVGSRMRLHCHHCGTQRPVARRCPDCGDQDLQPMGRGTQRLDEHLQTLFPEHRIVRIDADSTRRKGSAEQLFAQVHTGEADILVGTQMVSKGHDFENLGLVVVLNSDSALFSQDFRAPERLFAQLVQVAGRAGRRTLQGQVIVQTDYPDHDVYQALREHDYVRFADTQLELRQMAALPPFSFQALLSAQAKELETVMAFLGNAKAQGEQWVLDQNLLGEVILYDAVALRVVRVADQCRAQLLIESTVRTRLHQFLRAWLPMLGSRHGSGGLRWLIEVDPMEI
ncbi:primosomal protein N' [Orrella sp. 11846]|uniref:primosomal protein N' n=1 Tax=Orrella sp. 11846 TaxID=3409913 RepID=UPI003B59AFBB